jgi:hypothetical protein
VRSRPFSDLLLAGLAVASLVSGCRRKHVPVESIPELGYPSCADEATLDASTTLVAAGHIRSGPTSREPNVVERFELRKTSCGYTLRARQEWPLTISDIEVRYDADLAPRWVWKRMTLPGTPRADGNADTRAYELRTGDVFIKRRDSHGQTTMEQLLAGGRMTVPSGARVGAVVGPGRGVITAWIKRAKLSVGEKSTELVLDFREMLETLEVATLVRNPDQYEPSFMRTVRVYTYYGRETVFADDDDVVIGDLAGMRPSDSLTTPEPESLPDYGGADPAHPL